MVPDVLVTRDSLPKTPAGKVDRCNLAELELGSGLPKRSTPADDPLTASLLEMWERLLKVPVPSTTSSFFAFGGHSLLAMKMFYEIEHTHHCVCNAQQFFHNPTIEGLVRLVQSNSGADWAAPLVPIARGKAGVRPLFLTPGVMGRADDYLHVADHLGRDVPIYAFEVAGLREQRARHDTLRAAALEYCKLMRSVQTKGPYAVAGYSSAAIVALAVAEAMVEQGEQGEQVDFLGLIDATPPHTVAIPSPFSHPRRLLRMSRTALGRVTEVYDQGNFLARFPRRAGSAIVRSAARWFPWLGEYKQTVDDLFQGVQVDFTPHDMELMQHQLQTSLQYEPRRLPLNAVLLRTRLDPFEGPHELDLGWGRVIRGDVAIEAFPGRHEDLLSNASAADLATALARHLGRRTVPEAAPAGL